VRQPPLPTAALITDIGNDLFYEASVERIAEWIEQCLSRLAPLCERIVVTQLPLVRRPSAARSAGVRAARWHHDLTILSCHRAKNFCGKDVQIELAYFLFLRTTNASKKGGIRHTSLFRFQLGWLRRADISNLSGWR
jgi:hypothetical protein